MTLHDTDEMIKKRLFELAKRSYANGQYVFSNFLDMQELSCYYTMHPKLEFAKPCLCGGFPHSERQMLRFGDAKDLGYELDFPIIYLKIEPLSLKFAEPLSHRDFLGALMNLGIERSCLGDICVHGNIAYVVCNQSIADFICQNLERVRHTAVSCKSCAELPAEAQPKLREQQILAASSRVDAVIAGVYNLSRAQAAELFRSRRVFINGRLCDNNSLKLQAEDVVSVRGHGRFIFDGLNYLSNKGKQNLQIRRYCD